MRALGITIVSILMISALMVPMIGVSGVDGSSSGYVGPFTLSDILPYDWTDWDQDKDGNDLDDLLQGQWSDLDGADGRIGINVHLAKPVTRSCRKVFHRHLSISFSGWDPSPATISSLGKYDGIQAIDGKLPGCILSGN